MIMFKLQQFLIKYPHVIVNESFLSDGKLVVHVIEEGRIKGQGVAITIDRAIERALDDYTERRTPDPRQTVLDIQ